jgi:hypothetical protein
MMMRERSVEDSNDSFMKKSAVLSGTPTLRITTGKGRQEIQVEVDLGKIGLRENSTRIYRLVVGKRERPKYYEIAREPYYEGSRLKFASLSIVDGAKATIDQIEDFSYFLDLASKQRTSK